MAIFLRTVRVADSVVERLTRKGRFLARQGGPKEKEPRTSGLFFFGGRVGDEGFVGSAAFGKLLCGVVLDDVLRVRIFHLHRLFLFGALQSGGTSASFLKGLGRL